MTLFGRPTPSGPAKIRLLTLQATPAGIQWKSRFSAAATVSFTVIQAITLDDVSSNLRSKLRMPGSRRPPVSWSCPLVAADFRDYAAIEDLIVLPIR